MISHYRFLNRVKKYSYRILLFCIVLYILLLIPHSDPEVLVNHSGKSFAWNQDQKWELIESRFLQARTKGCDGIKGELLTGLDTLRCRVNRLSNQHYDVSDSIFNLIEENIFTLGSEVAVCNDLLNEFIAQSNSLRNMVKEQSTKWDFNSLSTRERMYRLLYGSRAAIEEVMLQARPGSFSSVSMCTDENSVTPSASILGVKIHSGDILVSRGGAPTSALIARGNDFQGNFSHIALVQIDSGKVNIIESHIERGVTISSIDDYLRDKKLRVMVLRLRSDLPALTKDPLLPHKVATQMLESVRFHHIPYDFEMDIEDPSKMFCSEVVYSIYKQFGIILWRGVSTISSRGTISWLSAFGVKHFETQEPSDLEYDPQLSVIAEWRDKETLYKDHIDNAVIDAMLEGAECGGKLKYDWYLLPIARIMKAYSVVLNIFGKVGSVPEGMSATAALKNRDLTNRHTRIKEEVIKKAEEFKEKFGYVPPYWELLRLARQSYSHNNKM